MYWKTGIECIDEKFTDGGLRSGFSYYFAPSQPDDGNIIIAHIAYHLSQQVNVLYFSPDEYASDVKKRFQKLIPDVVVKEENKFFRIGKLVVKGKEIYPLDEGGLTAEMIQGNINALHKREQFADVVVIVSHINKMGKVSYMDESKALMEVQKLEKMRMSDVENEDYGFALVGVLPNYRKKSNNGLTKYTESLGLFEDLLNPKKENSLEKKRRINSYGATHIFSITPSKHRRVISDLRQPEKMVEVICPDNGQYIEEEELERRSFEQESELFEKWDKNNRTPRKAVVKDENTSNYINVTVSNAKSKTSMERMEELQKVFKIKKFSPVDCLVYAYLFRHANLKHITYNEKEETIEKDVYLTSVSINTISQETKISPKKVIQALKKLQENRQIIKYRKAVNKCIYSCYEIVDRTEGFCVEWSKAEMPYLPIPSNKKGQGDRSRWKRFNDLFGKIGQNDGLIRRYNLQPTTAYLLCLAIILSHYRELVLPDESKKNTSIKGWYFQANREELFRHMGIKKRRLRCIIAELAEMKLIINVPPKVYQKSGVMDVVTIKPYIPQIIAGRKPIQATEEKPKVKKNNELEMMNLKEIMEEPKPKKRVVMPTIETPTEEIDLDAQHSW